MDCDLTKSMDSEYMESYHPGADRAPEEVTMDLINDMLGIVQPLTTRTPPVEQMPDTWDEGIEWPERPGAVAWPEAGTCFHRMRSSVRMADGVMLVACDDCGEDWEE